MSKVTGSLFRKTVFWLHLGTGVVVGLIVAMLSLTGVLLTYEQQMVSWADEKSWPAAPAEASQLNVAEIATAAGKAGINAARITYYREPGKPALVGGGRRDPSTYVDTYTGEVLGQPDNATRRFMRTMTNWHRWFDVDGEGRGTAQFMTGAGNLAFLFLALSGAYLWLPKIFRWPLFRQRLRFAKSYRNAKERDFYWHHFFAAWSLIPLVVIVVTAVVISFSWAHDLLTGIAGDSEGRPLNVAIAEPAPGATRLDLDQLLDYAQATSDSWNSVALTLPEPDSRTVTFELDAGSGRQPHKRTTIVLDAYSGKVVDSAGFSEGAAETKAISMNRYLHTGEWFGFAGQTIAGLVSLATLFMVWTGFALAWRRLVVPLYRNR